MFDADQVQARFTMYRYLTILSDIEWLMSYSLEDFKFLVFLF